MAYSRHDEPDRYFERQRYHQKFDLQTPTVGLMRDEMKKDQAFSKYCHWHSENFLKIETGIDVLKKIGRFLWFRIPLEGDLKMTAHEATAMLDQYLKQITERLREETLNIQNIAEMPASNYLIPRQVEIDKIIDEYEEEYRKAYQEYRARFEIRFKLKNWDVQYLGLQIIDQKAELEKAKDLTTYKGRVLAYGECIPQCGWEQAMARKVMENAPLEKQLHELNRQIVEIDAECMAAAADATQFVDVISPNFLNNLSRFIHQIFHDNAQIPSEYLNAAAQDVATHMRRIFKKKRFEWVDINKRINLLYEYIKDEKSRMNRIVKDIENCEKEKTKLYMERKKYKTNIGNLKWMLEEARSILNYSEQGYASTYQELNRLKKKTIELEAELGQASSGSPEISPIQRARTASPIITSPQYDEISRPYEEAMGPPLYASSPVSTSSYPQQERPQSPSFRPSSRQQQRSQSPSFRPSSPQQERPQSPSFRPSSPQQERTQSQSFRPSSPQQERPQFPSFRPSSPYQETPESPTIISTPPHQEKEDTPYPRARPTKMQQDIPDDSSGNVASPASVSDYFKFLDDELPPSAMMGISGLSGSGSSHVDSLEGSTNSSFKKTFSIPSPGRREPLQIDVEVIPQNIRRSPSGKRVVCDVAVELQEAARFSRPPRRIEQRNVIVRGTPPISQTVGRRFDRKYGMFTPQSALKRRHVSVRSPLFEEDYESPPSPWGSGRKTHPEIFDKTPHVPSPPPPKMDTTIEWDLVNMY